jgi:hypothetical protein
MTDLTGDRDAGAVDLEETGDGNADRLKLFSTGWIVFDTEHFMARAPCAFRNAATGRGTDRDRPEESRVGSPPALD